MQGRSRMFGAATAFAGIAGTLLVAGETPLLALGASAGRPSAEVKERAGRSITLGVLPGIVYYTAEAEGYRVVATLGDADHWPLRVIATLRPGQDMTLSTPGAAGTPAAEVRLVRMGDRLILADAGQPID